MFLWTRSKQFWQARPEIFDKCPGFFLPVSENVKKFIFLSEKKIVPSGNLLFMTRGRQFWQSCWQNLDGSQKCSAMNPKMFRLMSEHDKKHKNFCSKKTVFLQVIQWTRQKQFRQSCWKILPGGQKRSPFVWKWKKSKVVFKTAFSY